MQRKSDFKHIIMKKYLPHLILLILTFMLYGRTINYEFVLDDSFAVQNNRFVQEGISSIPDIWSHGYFYGFNGNNEQLYRPLTQSVFAVVHTIFGESPLAFHLLNILLYYASLLLLYIILTKCLPKENQWMAWAVSILFAIHPLHVEVVANIKSLDELLGFLFGLLAIKKAMDFYHDGRKINLLLSLIFLLFAFFSKESALMFAIIIPLAGYFLQQHKLAAILKKSLFFLLPISIYLIIRYLVLDHFSFSEAPDILNNALLAGSQGEAFASAIQILGRYALLLIVPFRQSWDYSYNQIELIVFSHWSFWASLIFYLFILFIALKNIKNNKLLSFGIFSYLVFLMPVSNIIFPIGATMAERFMYAPSFGFIVAFVILIDILSRWSKTKGLSKNIRFALISLFGFFYLIQGFAYIPVWESNYSISKHGVEASPKSARAQLSWAVQLKKEMIESKNTTQKNTLNRKSLQASLKALEIYPQYASAAFETGDLYFINGDIPKAEEYFNKTLSIDNQHTKALNNIGVIHIQNGQNSKALEFFEQVLRIDPENSDALANKGLYFYQTGDKEQAALFMEESLKNNPTQKRVALNLAHIYGELGKTQKAAYYQSLANKLK